MYRLMLCEDDAAHAQALKHTLEPWKDLFQQICHCTSIEELEAALHDDAPPDILMMDICLPDENGIAAVKRLFPPGSMTQVIYVTGYVEYCTGVYETEHVSFLVKPIRPDECEAALRRAMDRLDEHQRQGITVREASSTHFLAFSSIRYIESIGRKLMFHTAAGTIETYGSLAHIEHLLDARFCRCHKSFLVNLDHVHAHDPPVFVLLDRSQVPISARLSTSSRQSFLHHMKRKTLLMKV